MEGYKNEYDFVLALNNKKVSELNPLFNSLIYGIFNNIDGNQIVKAWRNHYNQKTDVLIKINNVIKGISIKLGSRNSIHVEHIDSFIKYLKKNNISNEIINSFQKFHYADGTNDNTGIKRITAEEYKINHQQEIDNINKHFMNKELLINAIDRFVLKGNNSKYNILAIILGEPNNFVWLKKEDIIKILLSHIDSYCSSPHFSDLVCQPMNRCINYNLKYEKYRNYIQIKWYRLFDDIIEQMNNNVKKYQADHVKK